MKDNYEDELTAAEKKELEDRLAADPKMQEMQADLEKWEKKKAQTEQRMKDRIAKETEKARKERAHRLIVLGGLIEKHFGPVNEGDYYFAVMEHYLPIIFRKCNDPEIKAKLEEMQFQNEA